MFAVLKSARLMVINCMQIRSFTLCYMPPMLTCRDIRRQLFESDEMIGGRYGSIQKYIDYHALGNNTRHTTARLTEQMKPNQSPGKPKSKPKLPKIRFE